MDNWNNLIDNLISYKETGKINITHGVFERKESIDVLLNICNKHTKIFNINENLVKLLLLTKNKFRKEYNQPFISMFLNCNIKFREGEIIKGLLIQKVNSNIKETEEIREDTDVFCFIEKIDDKKSLFVNMPLNRRDGDELEKGIFNIYNFEKPDLEGLGIFAINFLDFLNNPEVELVKVERTIEQNNKRILKGKRIIPTNYFIRITGKLKIYIDELNSGGKFKYSHRFWVRGHFRTLRNEQRYGKKKGTKIWIAPYIKGEGVLINKSYNTISEGEI